VVTGSLLTLILAALRGIIRKVITHATPSYMYFELCTGIALPTSLVKHSWAIWVRKSCRTFHIPCARSSSKNLFETGRLFPTEGREKKREKSI